MKRLDEIISLVSSQKGIIDVGTDHGYIPVHFALTDYTGRLIASDINAGPLSAAKKIAKEHAVEEKINFTLANGLSQCSADEVDTIIIAGMGGDLICSILDEAEWTMNSAYQLILQPMTKAEILRFWLSSNGYAIEEERLAYENNRVFKVLSARYSGINSSLTDAELFTGALALTKDLPLFEKMLALETERMEKKVHGLVSSAHTPGEEDLYKNILHQMTDMRTDHDKSK